jgi:hypothetical protein
VEPCRNHDTASFTVDTVKVIVLFDQRKPNAPWQVLFEVDKGKISDTEPEYSAFSIFN